MKKWKVALDSIYDFKDSLNASLGRETRVEWNKRMFNEYLVYLRGLDFLGLDDVLDEILELYGSGLYKELLLAYNLRIEPGTRRDFSVDEASGNRLLFLAKKYLPVTGIRTVSLKITDINTFKSLHPMLETVYCLYSNSVLSWNDYLNVYFGGFAERLIMGLDKFDEISYRSVPTDDFFKKLAKTQITQKDTYDLDEKLFLISMHLEGEIFGMGFKSLDSDYLVTNSTFIRFLAGCSAAHNNREFTDPEDIINAYKTFFKLIKTDITVYKAPRRIIESMPEFIGYLVCDKCNNSFGLIPEESPEDYSDTCECGGELVYKEEI